MKQNSLTLPLVGGGIALLCFFFPWIKLDLSSLGLGEVFSNIKVAKNVSGFDMVTSGNGVLALALIAVIAIIGICIYMLSEKTPWKSRIPVLICSVVGVLLVLVALLRFMPGLNEGMNLAGELLKSADADLELDKIITFQFGGFGAVIGFALALIGGWNIPKSNTSMEDNEQDIAA